MNTRRAFLQMIGGSVVAALVPFNLILQKPEPLWLRDFRLTGILRGHTITESIIIDETFPANIVIENCRFVNCWPTFARDYTSYNIHNTHWATK